MSGPSGILLSRRFLLNLLEPQRVRVHGEIVEHHVGVVVFVADLLQSEQVGVGVCVPVHRRAGRTSVEAKVGEAVRRGLFIERIDDVDEAELLADPLDQMRGPRTPELEPLHGVRPDRFEETEQIVPIVLGRAEGCGRLEDNDVGSEDLRDHAGRVPPFRHRCGVLEVAVRRPVSRGDLAAGASVCGRRGLVRDELRGLHGEPEIRRRKGPPTPGARRGDRSIKGVLDLDRGELPERLGLAATEPAGAGPDHEERKARFPPGVLDMLRVRGIGPKKVKQLWQELGITDIETLRKAAQTHRLSKLKGFGEKTEEKILRSIELMKEGESLFLLAPAHAIAEAVLAHLRKSAPVGQLAAGGSLRRMKEIVHDIDILATSKDPGAVTQAFTTMPGVREVLASGESKSVVLLATDERFVQVDLRIVEPSSWGAALQYDTGSKDHNIHLRTMAQKRGLTLNEYGIFRDEKKIAGETEEDVYRTLGLRWIPPEMREDQGEIELAAEGELPRLVEDKNIHGEFHVHTNATDGVDPVEAIVDRAQELGYAYVGISDHSVSSTVAFGLSAEQALARRGLSVAS